MRALVFFDFMRAQQLAVVLDELSWPVVVIRETDLRQIASGSILQFCVDAKATVSSFFAFGSLRSSTYVPFAPDWLIGAQGKPYPKNLKEILL